MFSESDSLVQYVDLLFRRWQDRWAVAANVGSREVLLADLGSGLRRFLLRQLRHEPQNGGTGLQAEARPDLLVTKTPSIQHAGRFFDLFPEDRLLVIFRDGRAVVQSGIESFDWDFESAVRTWMKNARSVVELRDHVAADPRVLFVKYEDLVCNLQTQLAGVLDFLGLDATLYDFTGAAELPVSGSCEVRRTAGVLHWRPVEMYERFDPLGRFRDWDRKRHDQFNRVAGPFMKALGYELV